MKRSGTFTLIELIIVISIIAILAAILLPSLKKAKNSGLSIACVNNLKQIGTATLSYANDKSDFLPATIASGGDPYFEDMEYYTAVSSKSRTAEQASFFWCPADSYRAEKKLANLSYSQNTYMKWDTADSVYRAMKRLNGIKKPSLIIYRSDSYRSSASGVVFSINTYPFSGEEYNPDNSCINFPHNNRTNCLFADLHVSGNALCDLFGKYAIFVIQ